MRQNEIQISHSGNHLTVTLFSGGRKRILIQRSDGNPYSSRIKLDESLFESLPAQAKKETTSVTRRG